MDGTRICKTTQDMKFKTTQDMKFKMDSEENQDTVNDEETPTDEEFINI